MMGPSLGMGNRSAVDGFMLDDNWNLWSGRVQPSCRARSSPLYSTLSVRMRMPLVPAAAAAGPNSFLRLGL